MRVLFFHQVAQSIGLEYLSSALKEDGHEVELIFDPGFRNHPYTNLNLLSFLGPSWKEILGRVRSFKPDLIGISVLTNLFPSLLYFARMVKDDMDVPVIAGGSHPTMIPEVVIKEKAIDFVCEGEGEDLIRELARALERGETHDGIPGLWFRDRSGIARRGPQRSLRQDLDNLAFPDRTLFRKEGIIESALSCSALRGCPYSCGYCTNTALKERFEGNGPFLRRRSVKSVTCELSGLKEKYHPGLIAFVDEMFSIDQVWLEEFAPAYRERVGIPFYCTGYPLLLSDKVVSLLERAGCSQICMGIEAGDDRMRAKARGMRIDSERIVEAARRVRKAHIYLYVTCMFGLPGEGPDEMWKTVDLVVESTPNAVKSFVFYPLPGTPFFKTCIDEGLVSIENVRCIEEGRGSYHGKSLLNHPYGRLAFVLSRSLPVYMGMPTWARPWLKWVMKKEMISLTSLFHFLFYPFFVDYFHVLDFLNTLKVAIIARIRVRLGVKKLEQAGSGIDRVSSGKFLKKVF